MLEKPDLPDQAIISCLQSGFGLHGVQLAFLPLGADTNTAVYRVNLENRAALFLKLRKGDFDKIIVDVPLYLKEQGNQAIIAPIRSMSGQLWLNLDPYKLILYPYVDGKNGYEVDLSDRQWMVFGAALRAVHNIQIPPALLRQIPRETYSSNWREKVRLFQAQIGIASFKDPCALKLADFMRARRSEITHLVDQADRLRFALQSKAQELVLCHSDIHAGNLLLGANDALYIVDWDNPTLAPKERDLSLVGGSSVWNGAREADLFYQGYGPTKIDPIALAYYRFERIIQDIAAYCEQLFLTDAGGQDREQSLQYFTGQFLPNHEVDLANQTDR